MRIVIVNNYARVTGGADRLCFDLAAGLRRLGHDVAFLSTEGENNVETSGRFVSCEMTRENRDSINGVAAARVASRSLWNREAAGAMRDLAAEFEPDVLHAHKLYPQLSVSPIVVARRLRLPIVQTVHDYELISASALDPTGSALDRQETSFRYRALNDATFPVRRLVHAPRVTGWVAVSRSVAGRLVSKGIDARVIPNFTEPVLASGMPEEQRTGVAYVGRLAPEKGVLDIVDLAVTMPDLSVTIAGDGPLADEIARIAKRVVNLEYLGRLGRERVAELIARSRAVLLPSHWEEPAGLAAVEAMSLGTPVVAYRRGGLAEYVEDADAGPVIAPSTAALVEAVRELLADPQRWHRHSAAGRKAVASRHSVERCIQMYEELYEDQMVSRPGP